jgi:exosortase B
MVKGARGRDEPQAGKKLMDGPSDQSLIVSKKTSGQRVPERGLMLILAAALLIGFAPTYIKLVQGPWRTEQEGHGPLIIAGALWLAWQCRSKLQTAEATPAPTSGWVLLLLGLGLLVISRSQDLVMFEVASQLPILCGCLLLVGGWKVLRIFAFPLVFLIFAIPPPGWLLDAFTVPLKTMVSDWVAEILYQFDYPIAQNGVMIMIGPYQLMVKDACAGMNSIFALSAIGVFYIHEFVKNSKFRAMFLLLSIVPITILANFVRVMALVLIAYYFGIDAIEGIFHDLTGFTLFVVALGLFFLLDGVLIALAALFRVVFWRSRPQASVAPPPPTNRMSVSTTGQASPAN